MAEPSHEVRVPRLEWWRFAVVACFTLAVFVGVGLIGDGEQNSLVEMGTTGLSIVAFLAYRFHRVRTDTASGRLSQEEFARDPRQHLWGSKVVASLWLGFTMILLGSLVFLRAQKGF
jgi:hypothetical protein